MYIQLRSIYDILYKGDEERPPLLAHRRQEGETPAQKVRWELPEVQKIVEGGYRAETLTERRKAIKGRYDVRNQHDFVRLHFQPVYSKIEATLTSEQKETNLKDMMSKGAHRYRGTGSFIRGEIEEFCEQDENIARMVATQQVILDQYDYCPEDFRDRMMKIVDENMAIPDGKLTSAQMWANIAVQQCRVLLIRLLGSGDDAAALAYLMLFAVLQERCIQVLVYFQMPEELEGQHLPGDIRMERQQLCGDFSISYAHMPGLSGSSITLWQTLFNGLVMPVNILTDAFGYFFYPVTLEEGIEPSPEGERICRCACVYPISEEETLLEWTRGTDVLYARFDETGRFIEPFSSKRPAVLDEGDVRRIPLE